jgi:hypothetical protein
MAARDYGDMTAQERIERQIRILDECIASLLDNEVRKYRESLLPAVDNAVGILRGTKALLEDLK